MTTFKIRGVADEGKCDHCGANCPKRRVHVETADGVECWGVICASKIRGDRGIATDVKRLSQFAAAVDAVRAAVAGGEAAMSRANRWNFPMNFRAGVVQMWCSRHNGKPDAELATA